MVIEVVPFAGVWMLGRSSVVPIEHIAYMVNDRIQVVQHTTSATCTHKLHVLYDMAL